MYVDPGQTLFQGDILDRFVFSTATQPTEDELSSRNDIPENFRLKSHLVQKQAIILSQTCDIARRPLVSIAPIFELKSFTDALAGKTQQNIDGQVSQLKNQKLFYYFYIAPDPQRGIVEGYADLTFINPIERLELPRLNVLASVTDYQRHILAYKLGNLFIRPH